jgi:arylsulfatase A-like enzyme
MTSLDQRPNIVLIVADDHRFDTIGAYGAPVHTPNLDRLVRSGVSFRNAYMPGGMDGAVCVPARAALHTGQHPFRCLFSREDNPFDGTNRIRPESPLLGEMMQKAGYDAYAIGKWHNDKSSFARSFNGGSRLFFGGMSEHDRVPVWDFDPQGKYADDQVVIRNEFSSELFTDAAIDFLRNRGGERPFLLHLAYTAPHDPRTPPRPYRDMYDPASIPLPANFASEHPFDNGEQGVRDELLAALPRDPNEIRRHIADYYGMVTHMDACIGRVLNALQERGLTENTIVVYMSDHGLALGQHGLMGKQNLYEHSIRIPLIASGPGFPAGSAVVGLTSLLDVLPTLCDLAYVRPPSGAEGRSLLRLVRGEAQELRSYTGAAYKSTQRMIRHGDWKLIRYFRSPSGRVGTERTQLFNLSSDPAEIRDLSGKPEQAERIRHMNGLLREWMSASGDPLYDRLG